MRVTRPLLIVLTLTTATALVVGAQTKRSTPQLDPEADRLLLRMSEFLASAGTFRFHADVYSDEIQDNGEMIQLASTHDIAVSRPNRFMSTRHGDERNVQVAFDGRTFTAYQLDLGFYATTSDAGETIDEVLDYLFDRYDISVPIADVISADPYAILTDHVESGEFIGFSEIDGVEVAHVACQQEFIDWQVWIEEGPRPVLRRMVITYKSKPGSPRYTAELSGWEFGVHLPATAFQLTLPEDVERIEFATVATRGDEK